MKKFTFLLSLLLSLTAAWAQNYPFTLTTDPANPALYYIYSGRDGAGQAGGCVFCNEIPYGESKHKLVLMYKNPNNVELTQLWYIQLYKSQRIHTALHPVVQWRTYRNKGTGYAFGHTWQHSRNPRCPD